MVRNHVVLIVASIIVSVSGFLLANPFGEQVAADHDYWHTFLTTGNASSTNTNTTTTTNTTDFKLAMRSLWVDHVVWTRQYIVDFSADLPSTNDTANRLLKNQEDIGTAIKPYYGEEAGNHLTDLLKQHILIAVDLVAAAKDGNTTALNAANTTWYQNADEIATFLSTANPNFNKTEMQTMLNEHLRLTTGEAVARLTGNYTADIAAFDEIHKQAMVMADGLSSGIIAQFPERFEDPDSVDEEMEQGDQEQQNPPMATTSPPGY